MAIWTAQPKCSWKQRQQSWCGHDSQCNIGTFQEFKDNMLKCWSVDWVKVGRVGFQAAAVQLEFWQTIHCSSCHLTIWIVQLITVLQCTKLAYSPILHFVWLPIGVFNVPTRYEKQWPNHLDLWLQKQSANHKANSSSVLDFVEHFVPETAAGTR